MSEQPKKQAQAKRPSGGRAAKQQQARAQAAPQLDVTQELVNRAKRDIGKMSYVTPSKLAASLNVKLSLARKVLKRLAADGVVDVRAKNRRIIVVVPKSSS